MKCAISGKETKSDSEKIVLVLCSIMNEWPSSWKREVEQELLANLKRNLRVDCYTVLIRWALHGWQSGQPSIPSLQVFAHKADLCCAEIRWQGYWWVISVPARVYSLRTSVTRSYSRSSIDQPQFYLSGSWNKFIFLTEYTWTEKYSTAIFRSAQVGSKWHILVSLISRAAGQKSTADRQISLL